MKPAYSRTYQCLMKDEWLEFWTFKSDCLRFFLCVNVLLVKSVCPIPGTFVDYPQTLTWYIDLKSKKQFLWPYSAMPSWIHWQTDNPSISYHSCQILTGFSFSQCLLPAFLWLYTTGIISIYLSILEHCSPVTDWQINWKRRVRIVMRHLKHQLLAKNWLGSDPKNSIRMPLVVCL